ncbi:MAG: diol dehydratase small subunit [Albidovulum sp.]
MTRKLTLADYPLAETRPETVKGARGIPIDRITVKAVMAGDIGMEDLRITPQALLAQAEIASAAGRRTLARNFERAAELVHVPQDIIMETYEMLRPGRVHDPADLIARADMLSKDYNATQIADFLREAAEIYTRRGFFGGRSEGAP